MRARKKASRTPTSAIRSSQLVAERVVAAMMTMDTFSKWLGLTLIDVRPRRATVRATVRPEMVNGFGVSHGGIVYSLADSALAFAANTNGNVTVAIENSISYPQPVHIDDTLTAVAEEESFTNRLGYFRVSVRNQNELLVAIFRGTVYKTKRSHG